jgi:hypothetical protein
MFRAVLAHPQEVLVQTAIGILRAWFVSWLDQNLRVDLSTDTHQVAT